mmetsp:Transcript_37509/g.94285  ORF Transcript_37509/g.94285 Transcript_37509/m.94285 type:complete len:281 (-) Transcript_37509:403-1245(-)
MSPGITATSRWLSVLVFFLLVCAILRTAILSVRPSTVTSTRMRSDAGAPCNRLGSFEIMYPNRYFVQAHVSFLRAFPPPPEPVPEPELILRLAAMVSRVWRTGGRTLMPNGCSPWWTMMKNLCNSPDCANFSHRPRTFCTTDRISTASVTNEYTPNCRGVMRLSSFSTLTTANIALNVVNKNLRRLPQLACPSVSTSTNTARPSTTTFSVFSPNPTNCAPPLCGLCRIPKCNLSTPSRATKSHKVKLPREEGAWRSRYTRDRKSRRNVRRASRASSSPPR